MSIPQNLIRAANGSLVNFSQVTTVYKQLMPGHAPGSDARYVVKVNFQGVSVIQKDWSEVYPTCLLASGLTEAEADLLLDEIEDWLMGSFRVSALLTRERQRKPFLASLNPPSRADLTSCADLTEEDTHA